MSKGGGAPGHRPLKTKNSKLKTLPGYFSIGAPTIDPYSVHDPS